MSKKTTGRQMLEDLEKRVAELEGPTEDPLAALKAEIGDAIAAVNDRIKSINQRLTDLETKA